MRCQLVNLREINFMRMFLSAVTISITADVFLIEEYQKSQLQDNPYTHTKNYDGNSSNLSNTLRYN